MPNRYKVGVLTAIAVLSIGAISTLDPQRIPAPDPTTAPLLSALYVAPVERAETHVLGRGQTLGALLAQARLTGQEMSAVLLELRAHIDPRRMRYGAELTVRRWVETDEPRTVEVRMNADSTIRLVRAPVGWNAEVVLTPTSVDTIYTAGDISHGGTLYDAIVYDDEAGLPAGERYNLVMQLAEIYEFKLDFRTEIQPGDAYRLVYEREARPDGTSRSSRILAAEMVTRGQPYTAFYFDAGHEARGYYDREGRPLATGFSRYPIPYRITSQFSNRRYHPILGVYRAHQGIDFGAPRGTSVLASADGTVVYAGTNGGYGNMIEIRHFGGWTTRYAHLQSFATGIRVGTRVMQKQVIGRVGATGLATGPHLHYELRLNGQARNPATANLPDAPPLPGALRERFQLIAAERGALLDRVEPPARLAGNRGGQSGARGDEL